MELQVQTVEKVTRPENRGPGHSARLVIMPFKVAEHSPFILMAEDWFVPPAGFPTHPHRGIETVTFVLAGRLLHADHTGGAGRLNPGDAQFMTAGGGVMHSEMPGPDGVQTLQLWLNLPARLKMTPARYQDMRLADAPALTKDGVEARVYAGRIGDLAVPHARPGRFSSSTSGSGQALHSRFPSQRTIAPLSMCSKGRRRSALTSGRSRRARSPGPRFRRPTASCRSPRPRRRGCLSLQARSSTSRS